MRTAVLVLLTLLVQRALGLPAVHPWASEILLPVVWVVAPAMLHHGRQRVFLGLAVGLAWDLMLEEVVGPGGVSWSAAAWAVGSVSAVVADRSPRAWIAMGALGAIIIVGMRQLTFLPLGLESGFTWWHLLRTTLLTAGWCGLVGWILALDLPARWRRHRARVLR